MKLIASGVANCAAIVRSPSFSRSSSSQTTTIRPRADVLDRLLDRRERRCVSVCLLGHRLLLTYSRQPTALARTCEHVALQVDAVARLGGAERRALERLGDQRDLEAVVGRAPATVRLTPSTAIEPFSTT